MPRLPCAVVQPGGRSTPRSGPRPWGRPPPQQPSPHAIACCAAAREVVRRVHPQSRCARILNPTRRPPGIGHFSRPARSALVSCPVLLRASMAALIAPVSLWCPSRSRAARSRRQSPQASPRTRGKCRVRQATSRAPLPPIRDRRQSSGIPRELRGQRRPLDVLLTAVLLVLRFASPEVPIPIDRDVASSAVRCELNDSWHGPLLF